MQRARRANSGLCAGREMHRCTMVSID